MKIIHSFSYKSTSITKTFAKMFHKWLTDLRGWNKVCKNKVCKTGRPMHPSVVHHLKEFAGSKKVGTFVAFQGKMFVYVTHSSVDKPKITAKKASMPSRVSPYSNHPDDESYHNPPSQENYDNKGNIKRIRRLNNNWWINIFPLSCTFCKRWIHFRKRKKAAQKRKKGLM